MAVRTEWYAVVHLDAEILVRRHPGYDHTTEEYFSRRLRGRAVRGEAHQSALGVIHFEAPHGRKLRDGLHLFFEIVDRLREEDDIVGVEKCAQNLQALLVDADANTLALEHLRESVNEDGVKNR